MELPTTSLVMVLTAAACILQSTCSVCPYTVKGCHCGHGAVFCNGLQSLPALYTGPDVINCTSLSFGAGNITSIPKGSLPTGLQIVEMRENPIAEIADDAFVDSATTLQELYLTGLKLKHLPSALLKLANLSILEISNTPIETLEESVLQHIATSLTHLTLTNLNIVGWPSGMTYFRSLTVLHLDGNSLKEIPDSALNSSKDSLYDLSLVSTGLTHVPKSLPSLLKLQLLDLSGNSFVDVDEFDSLFPSGSQLNRLTINSVGLTKIPNFSNLASLDVIYLNNNNISNLSVGSFPSSLVELHLAFNHLTSLPADFDNMSRLSFLDLTNNSLSSIPSDLFRMSRLSILGLENNKISRIEPRTLPTSLSTLRLSSNQISEINPADFPSSLSYLFLGFNQITEIKPEPFPTGLSWLDLSHNRITQINTSNLPLDLSYLDLSYNQINKIVPDGFNYGLRQLYLSHNNLSSISKTTFQNLTNLVGLYLNNNPISSIPDLAFADLKSLINLDLDSTNLTEIPVTIGDLPNMGDLGGTVSLGYIPSMHCPCPRPTKLVNWMEALTNIQGYCSNGFTISQYIFTECEMETWQTVLTVAITEITTPPDNASVTDCSFLSVCSALFLLLSLHLLRDRVNYL